MMFNGQSLLATVFLLFCHPFRDVLIVLKLKYSSELSDSTPSIQILGTMFGPVTPHSPEDL